MVHRLRSPWYILLVLSMCVGIGLGCGSDSSGSPGESTNAAEFDGQEARMWMDEVLRLIEAEATSPPRASRILAYTGVAIYESTVDGMPEHQSLGGQLNDLNPLPPINGDSEYDFPSVLHGAMGHLGPLLFDEIDSAEQIAQFADLRLNERRDAGVSSSVVTDSANRGVLLAEAIDAWASTDGYYERASIEFAAPAGPHIWVPTDNVEEPLEPNWATLRPFALSDASACMPAAPVAFSTDHHSTFYQEAMTVWETTEAMTAEEESIAHFWADNPGETATPAGHWMHLASQMIEDLELNLEDSAELYALMGVVGADAFISCWDEKYRSYLVRPVTYIQQHIDSDWESPISTPPFPEYTSGHSNISGASAKILTELLGNFGFENRTHVERGLGIRHFDSFQDAAQEAAISRLYGGIHFPMGIDYGVPQGECVANQLLERVETRRP